MKTIDIGKQVQQRRKAQGLTQQDLALTANVGIRFVSELERGKSSCQLGKTLMVLATLGLDVCINEKGL